MSLTRKLSLQIVAAFLLLTACCLPAQSQSKKKIPGPREPLTARDVGVYGGWNEEWFREDSPLTYLMVQATITEKGNFWWHGNESRDRDAEWNKMLRRARARGLRIIAVLGTVAGPNDDLDLKNWGRGLDRFLEMVDEDQLYAISISEENIFWNNRVEELKAAYAYGKKKTDVPIYQWYSPRAHAPGFGAWPHIPADGWLVDEYAHPGPSFEELMRGFSAHQVPVFQIVWAAPSHRSFDWDALGEPSFDWQLAVCRKYNIPTAFFMWEGRGGGWGWTPGVMQSLKRVYQRTLDWADQAKYFDLKAYAAQWDDYPALQGQALRFLRDGSVNYNEDFMKSGGLIARGAVRRGFRDTRWHGGPLELRPRQTGAGQAVVQYPFESELPIRDIRVTIDGSTNPRLQGSIGVSASADGLTWTPEQFVKGKAPFILSLANDARFQGTKNLFVRMNMKGRANRIGDVPASISSFNVTGAVVKPVAKEVVLRAIPYSTTKWSIVPSGTQLFTADIDNIEQVVTSQNSIGMESKRGAPNKVTIRQKFVSAHALDLTKMEFWSYAQEKPYGSVNTLGISVDGKNVLVEKSTAGLDDNNPKVAVDLSKDDRLKNVKEFWLHITMSSEASQYTTNEIKYLSVQGTGVVSEGDMP